MIALRLAGVVGVLLLITPKGAWGQTQGLSLDLAGGAHVPVGNAAHAAATSAALSIGIAHPLNRRVALTTDFQVSAFSGGPFEERLGMSTDISLLAIRLGAEVLLTPPASSWRLSSLVTGGLSTVGTDGVRGPAPLFLSQKINDDVLTLGVGLQLSRSLGTVAPFVRVKADVYFIGSNLEALRGLDERIGDSGSLVGIPVQVGMRFGF